MNGKVLLVDDDPTAVMTIEAAFSGEGYELTVADSGAAALEKANAILPDLILLDVMMPVMDGFEACRRLRATPKLAEVPIIMLTALDDRASRLHGIESGADDFITKPVDRQELRLRARTILRLNRYRTLLTQRENLRELAHRVVNAQEEERKRISRELHDDLGQALIAQTLTLRNLQSSLPLRPEELQSRLDGLIADTNQTLNRMRLLAQDLRPTLLDTLGLKGALETYCREFGFRSGLPVTCELEMDMTNFSDVYAITLYRFLQEALTNVVKHAQAKQIWVELFLDEEDIVMSVQDNGSGIADPHGMTQRGIGIAGLRERLTIVGGKLAVTSSANGTIVSAHLPATEVAPGGGHA